MTIDLAGKTALVTGGAAGIGLATATALRERGATVVVGDILAEGREAAAQVGARFIGLDVRDIDEYRRAYADVLEHDGRLDIVHLNAGVMSPRPGEAIGRDGLQWVSARILDRVFPVNVYGVVNGVVAACDLVPAPADIVVTSSIAGVSGLTVDPVYAASKHAVLGFLRSTAPLLRDAGIRLQALCPGGIDTQIVAPDMRRARRFAAPSYAAGAVLHALEHGAPGDIWMATDEGVDYWRYEAPPARR